MHFVFEFIMCVFVLQQQEEEKLSMMTRSRSPSAASQLMFDPSKLDGDDNGSEASVESHIIKPNSHKRVSLVRQNIFYLHAVTIVSMASYCRDVVIL
jgi:hypothetical protein